jgi:hypothetical protein
MARKLCHPAAVICRAHPAGLNNEWDGVFDGLIDSP